jgi:hypothetical protein
MATAVDSQSDKRRWAPTSGSGHTALRSRGEATTCFKGRRPARENEESGGFVGGSFWTEQRENKGRGSLAWYTTRRGREGQVVHVLERGGPMAGSAWRRRRREAVRRGAQGGSVTVARGPLLENVGWPREKGDGLGPRKLCRVAAVN